jgi:hypothetical protein
MALNSTRINKIGNDASVPAPAIAPGSHTACLFGEPCHAASTKGGLAC